MKHDKTKAVFRERDLLEYVSDSPFFVHLVCTFQDEKTLYFIQEYLPNGNLKNLI